MKKRSKTRSKNQKQSSFFDSTFQISKEFGGTLHGKGNAKKARPLSTKNAMHVVLRSSAATGTWSMRSVKNIKIVDHTVRKLAKQYGIKIYKFANVGNHLHLLIKLSKRFTFAPFVRALAGIIAMKVTGARKLSAMKTVLSAKFSSSSIQAGQSSGSSTTEQEVKVKKFWDYRPWSRIVEWGKAYNHAKAYVVQNEQEAAGEVPYKARQKKAQPRRRPRISFA